VRLLADRGFLLRGLLLGLLLRRLLRGALAGRFRLRRALARRGRLRVRAVPRCRGSGRGRLLLRSFLAASAAFRRGGEQRLALVERQRFRLAVLRYLRVLRAVRDVRPVAAVQDLHVRAVERLDDPVRVRLLLVLDQLERALERDRVRIVVAANRYELIAVADVRPEAADVRRDGLAVRRRAELARQLEELERLVERDVVHLLPGTQA